MSDDTTEDANNPNKNVINLKSFKYKTSITRSSTDYNVDETVIGDGGNPVPNPDYDAIKLAQKI